MRTMRVTMRDVAKKANVSVSTVSLVLNEVPGIAASTRQQVQAVIRELNYTPNAQARRFASGQTGAVALVMPPWSAAFADPYYQGLMRGVLEAVRDRGYQLLLEVCDDRFVEHRLWNDLFTGKKVDGLIVATPYLDQGYLKELVEHHYPTMLINGERADLPGLDYVGYDDFRCGQDATNYLIGLGHRRIAHIAGSANQASAINRQAGYRAALQKAGLPFHPEDIVAGDFMPLEAKEALRNLLSHPADRIPSAIFCANDTMALSVMTHLSELGHRIPKDFSVIGVDDTGPAERSTPGLTTFRQDIFELARTAAGLFIAKLETKPASGPIQQKLVMPLIERASCCTVKPRF